MKIFQEYSTPYTPINNALILNYRIIARESMERKPVL